MVRQRQHVSIRQRDYLPEWNREVVGYAKSFLAKNVWRVGTIYDLDDLLQESYMLFVRLRERYTITGPRHFMAMWKTCLHNWLHNLAKERRRHREVTLSSLVTEDEDGNAVEWQPPAPAKQQQEVDFRVHFREAPPAVKKLVTRAKRGRPPRLSRQCVALGGRREKTNEYLCRIAGVDPTTPLRRMFRDWLRGDLYQEVCEEEIVEGVKS